MSIFSFKKCESKSEARKVKIIYSILFIVLFVVSNSIATGIVPSLILKYCSPFGVDFKGGWERIEACEKFTRVIAIINYPSGLLLLLLTIWAALKVGIKRGSSLFFGFLALLPVVSLTPFIIILTRKFSPKQFEDKVKLP